MKLLACVLCAAAVCAPLFAQSNDKNFKADKAKLAKVSKQRDNAKTAMMKHKGDPGYKHSFVEFNDELASQTMAAGWLTPHEKYSTALRLYRYSLQVDPHDANAKSWVDMIVSIYKSMHRPVPK